jgi:hypothetical protein
LPEDPRNLATVLDELRQSGEAIGRLAEDEKAFTLAQEAFRNKDAARFQEALVAVDIFEHCRLVCRWFCSVHCCRLCRLLCGAEPVPELDPGVVREFSRITAGLARDERVMVELLDAVEREDADAFKRLLVHLKLERFCHCFCRWLCMIRCRRVCRFLCPPPPVITKVGNIPISQVDLNGHAAGPSSPPGTTPTSNPAAGIGHHAFGGITNIRGAFGIASPHQYKVEFAPAPTGPWTPILTPVEDFRINPAFPPIFIFYPRVPSADGWYDVADMGLAGADYLTDWQTPPVPDQPFYLRLTVRTASLAQFSSSAVAVRVDNKAPDQPVIDLALQFPDGTRRPLACCERVERGNGNVVVVTLQAKDENFGSIGVSLLGGCGWSLALVATNGTPLSKTYNGNITDQGYPVPTEFLWDPWAARVEPCCYIIQATIADRAIVGNHYSPHQSTNWRSITIA